MTNQEAERLADAICEQYYNRINKTGPKGWRDALTAIIVRVLCAPAPLGWERKLSGWFSRNAQYRIHVADNGEFYVTILKTNEVFHAGSTFADANKFAQAHHEARQ